MDVGEKRKQKILQPVIMNLPEQILRQIFRYLDLISLYVSLRKVCHRMKTYVDRYIGTGGLYLFIRQSGSSVELYGIFRQPSGKSNIYKKLISPMVCNGDVEHKGLPCRAKCPPFQSNSLYQINYFSWNDELVACKNHYCKESRLYQYQFMTDTWNVIFNEVSFCEARYIVQTCKHMRSIYSLEGLCISPIVSAKKHQHLPLINDGTVLKIPPYLVINCHKETGLIQEAICHDGEGFTEFPMGEDSLFNFSVCAKSNRIYLVGGIWKHPYAYGNISSGKRL